MTRLKFRKTPDSGRVAERLKAPGLKPGRGKTRASSNLASSKIPIQTKAAIVTARLLGISIEPNRLYDAAMMIDNQICADIYFAVLVRHIMVITKWSRAEAEKTVRRNLGFYTGYYDEETRRRACRLFKCEHPCASRLGVPARARIVGEGIK